MEFDTPLNKAHCQVRKSEKLLKTGKFDEAIALQDRIVELLKEALEDANDAKVHESLVLQIEYHTKQKQLIGHKQASWEHFCKQLANLQVKMSNVSGSAGSGDGLQVFIHFLQGVPVKIQVQRIFIHGEIIHLIKM